ncbi:hypothetical protein EVA_22106, partial [gut metagenome]
IINEYDNPEKQASSFHKDAVKGLFLKETVVNEVFSQIDYQVK